MESRTSRFESNPDLISLQAKIDEINQKSESLKAQSQNSLYIFNDRKLLEQKHQLLLKFQGQLSILITKFNNEEKNENALTELNNVTKLIADLHECVTTFLKLNIVILNKPSNVGKSLGKNTIYYSSKAATLGALSAGGGLTVSGLIIGWYLSSGLSSGINTQLGFATDDSTTITLIKELLKQLEIIYNSFSEKLIANNVHPMAKINYQSGNSLFETGLNFLNSVRSISSSDTTTDNSNDNDESNSYSQATKSYIDNIQKKKLLDQIKELNLTENEEQLFAGFKDPITNEYFDVPVSLNEHILDLNTLLRIDPNSKGERKDPYSSDFKFKLCHIQPALEIANQIKSMIDTVKKQRAEANSGVQVSQKPSVEPVNTTLTLQNTGSPLHRRLNNNPENLAVANNPQLAPR